MRPNTPNDFWHKVNKQSGRYGADGKFPTECWEWTGCTNRGYGEIRFRRRQQKTHRVSWILHFGEITNELCVLHKCDNPTCVRPDHLFLGTRKDNHADGVNKGRIHFPSQKPRRKCTEEQVREIRRLYAIGISDYKLCEQFSISRATIYSMVKNLTYKEVV